MLCLSISMKLDWVREPIFFSPWIQITSLEIEKSEDYRIIPVLIDINAILEIWPIIEDADDYTESLLDEDYDDPEEAIKFIKNEKLKTFVRVKVKDGEDATLYFSKLDVNIISLNGELMKNITRTDIIDMAD